ncbi:MAG: GatB/YqeY domain-containing protein [Polyangiales bacterium]
MLLDDLRQQIQKAAIAKDAVARDVLRLVLGEAQTAEANAKRALEDAEIVAIVRKLVKSNHETLALAGDGPQVPTLRREIEILTALMPKTLSVAQIVEALAPVRDAIVAAKADGPATGVASKHLKSTGASFEGSDAAAAVKAIRGG